MKKLLLTLIFGYISVSVFAQKGEISGVVLDENGEGVIQGTVAIVKDGKPTGKVTLTDFDGKYSLKPLDPGKYDIQFSYTGYSTQIKTGVVVAADKTTYVNADLKPKDLELGEVVIVEYKVPLIDKGNVSNQQTLTSEEIASMPTRDIGAIAAQTGGVYQGEEGGGLNIKGGRGDATAIYIDGVRVRGSSSIPANAIGSLTTLTGGVPAKYGDVTGGVVSVTTKGPSNKYYGGIELITSQFMDAQGYNLVSANLSGPLYTRYRKTDSASTKIGFFLSGEYETSKDPRPSRVGAVVVKDDVLKQLKQNPIIRNPNGEGYLISSETVTAKDFETLRSRPNVRSSEYRVVGKLDFRTSEATNLTIGGQWTYKRFHEWIDRYMLFNPENNPLHTDNAYRGYIRFTHNIGGAKATEKPDAEKKSKVSLQNPFYTIQFDYEKSKHRYEDESHKDKFFNYGYIGKYDINFRDVFEYTTHEIKDKNGTTRQLRGWKEVGSQQDSIVFTGSSINGEASRFNEELFRLVAEDGGKISNLFDANYFNGIIGFRNGQRTQPVNGIWFNYGRQYNGYGVNNNDQFTARFDASFDIVKSGAEQNKHSIEFGFMFEQRIERTWNINPLGLWTIMQQSANQHLNTFDLATTDPTLIINGVKYKASEYDPNDPSNPVFGDNDTILVGRDYDPTLQSNFDKKLRQKLGMAIDGRNFINIDALGPENFTLDMFTADELRSGQGNDVLGSIYGYDYKGKLLSGRSSFNDFFTKRDENGNMKREIPAFQPIYIAGYIQDRFSFKDLNFNIGVRIDRYDANQKVLADPYSLYPIKTVEEAGITNAPSNIGKDFKVYINDLKSNNPTVVGYRDGAKWYDVNGVEIKDGSTLVQSTGTVVPYLVDKDANITNPDKFNPSASFVDYKPQIQIMPRLQFSFNLSDKAQFFAHYDQLSQRPGAGDNDNNIIRNLAVTNPYNFLYLPINGNSFINNGQLLPELTMNFALGFRQRVSERSAVTLSAYYKENRNQVQLIQRAYVYPNTYQTFDNIDFSTVKGFEIAYDMRRTGNLQLKLNYTLQFVDGTGSSNQSQQALINAGEANLRSISPLDYDVRNTFNIIADWRYEQGSKYNGPYIGKQQIFSNAGINLTMSARSGTPYTKQRNATGNGLSSTTQRAITEGTLNGTRKPWIFNINTKINKSFNIKTGKKDDKGVRKGNGLDFDVYLLIQNLINAKNILNVYRYTGTADDDGYLNDPLGVADAASRPYPESFKDMYKAQINRPGNFARPIAIRLGLSMNF